MLPHWLPVLLAAVSVCDGDINLLLLHTNDMHSRFQQADRYLGMCPNDTTTACYGGFARLKTEVDARKRAAEAANRTVLFLNAGDNFQGTPYFTFFKWPIVSQFVSMLGIDVMSLGNHEFDDGVSSLSQYLKNVTVGSICANLNLTEEPSLQGLKNLSPSILMNINGLRIGVIGYLTPDTKFLSKTGKVQILDEITSVRQEAQKLLSMKPPPVILIALGHSGYLKDQQIAQEVEEIDLVVGGHSHTFLYSGTPPDPVDVPKGPYPTVVTQASGKKVPVVQAYYGTKYLGYLELNFDDEGNLKNWTGQPILLSGDLPQDKDVLAALKPYEDELHDKIMRIVGYSEVLLDNNDYACKLGECNMGNLIADAYVDYVTRNYTATRGWTEAAVGIVQSGGIRASINTKTNVNHNGSITLGDVITVLPWGDSVVVKDLPGSVLLDVLEFSVHRYEETIQGHVNEFLQVAGLKVVYNISAPSGYRVASVQVRCADCDLPTYFPLNISATYSVVMPLYLGQGGDGYYMLPSINSTFVLGDVDYMILANYIELHSPVYPTVEGRITIINGTTPSPATTTSPATTSSAATTSVSWTVYLIVAVWSLTRI